MQRLIYLSNSKKAETNFLFVYKRSIILNLNYLLIGIFSSSIVKSKSMNCGRSANIKITNNESYST